MLTSGCLRFVPISISLEVASLASARYVINEATFLGTFRFRNASTNSKSFSSKTLTEVCFIIIPQDLYIF